MTTTRQILRCVQRLGQVKEGGAGVLNLSTRCASTLTKKKFIEGTNGEKIFPSPYGEFKTIDMLIPEYVWKNCESFGKKTALECGISGRKYTYSEARDAAQYIARSLLNMGLRKNDVVALIAPNYPETILGFLGILEAELVVTTANPFYTADEMSKQLKSSGAKAVITTAEIAPTVLQAARATMPGGVPFMVIEDGTGPIPDGAIPFKDLIERGRSLPPFSPKGTSPDDLAILPYSSGTTGLPKGVMLTHNNVACNMEMSKMVDPTMWQTATDSFQEVIPLFLPFFHIFGMNCVVLPRMAEGVKLITLPKFTSETFISVLDKNRMTGMMCVPPIVLFLSASPAVKKSHLESMHHIFSGAAPLAEADVQRLYEKFGIDDNTLQFCQGYGLTETAPVNCLEISGKKFASIGKNVPGCDLRLVDPVTNENISTPGQSGELWIRGPHVMKGYLNNEKATRETLVEDGWLKSGDIAYFDEDLDFFITDRSKELIKVKGFQVPPAELEALLRTHPEVQEAAVIGIPDERCGEVPKAFVLPKKGKKPTEEEIKNFMKGKVSDYKELQGGVTFVDEIPKNPSGKILRMKLKNEYHS